MIIGMMDHDWYDNRWQMIIAKHKIANKITSNHRLEFTWDSLVFTKKNCMLSAHLGMEKAAVACVMPGTWSSTVEVILGSSNHSEEEQDPSSRCNILHHLSFYGLAVRLKWGEGRFYGSRWWRLTVFRNTIFEHVNYQHSAPNLGPRGHSPC
jgi:hypothetical protein